MTKENAAPTLLLLIFITLKLTHQIDWSWWWVMAPMWVPALGAGMIGLVYLCWPSRKRRSY